MVLASPDEFELALRLFREDSLMAKREARRKRFFMTPGESRKLKQRQARKRAARNRRKPTT
jgi:ribosomal protein S21